MLVKTSLLININFNIKNIARVDEPLFIYTKLVIAFIKTNDSIHIKI